MDEFQELFVEDDAIAQDAALLLDRIVRQGRAFGVHVILGSQTLGGAYTLNRTTMGQMNVRIALQCSEADSYLILSEDNSAARLLNRPGEAIYNDTGGSVEGNSPFQIVWLPEATRDEALRRAASMAESRGAAREDALVVFEGAVPAALERNAPLREAIARGPAPDGAAAAEVPAWLGEPIAIREPTAAVFGRRGGSNLLIVGQREESALAMCCSAAVSIGALRADARVHAIDTTPPESPLAGAVGRAGRAAGGAFTVGGAADAGETVLALGAELDRRRASGAPGPPVFLMVCGLQRCRDLRAEDDSFSFGSFSGDEDDGAPASASRVFAELLREGPPLGIHAIVWADSVNAMERFIDRRLLREFDMRVAFQMSVADSTALIDAPDASRLGPQRALLASEEAGTLERFRPYALPESAALAALGLAPDGGAPVA